MKQVSAIFLIITLSVATLTAKDNYVDPYKGYDESAFMDMELDQNIMTPVVGKNEHSSVKRYMNRMAQDLARSRYTVDMTRNDEVIVVSIPSDDLFLPNDTLLAPGAPAKLAPIVALLSDPEMMKMVYAVHTDNTGSPSYNMYLSHERNNSIYDWLLDNINEDLIVIPYEFGDTDPLVANDTREGRRENRRIEIFLIPGPKMITMAHKGLLK
ncbi:MAG: OmpA family protein [Duncaniella sp.]|nr:OmpA family protein [Duncaniella sp.]MDE7145850.1 OmpA family protein [Duncaniella sp.]